jgi:hypothetical protein
MGSRHKIPIGRRDIVQHLRDERGLLTNSADLYDRGSTVEIKNMSARIRNLMHVGRYSSLLKQFGVPDDDAFYGTAGEPSPVYHFEHKVNPDGRGGQITLGSDTGSHLIGMQCRLGPRQQSNQLIFLPNQGKCRDFPPPPDKEGYWHYRHVGEKAGFKKMDFDSWWNTRVVFTFDGVLNYSRKQIVTDLVANKDGGTHTDPFIEIEYYLLLKNNWSFFCQVSPEGVQYTLGSKVFPIVRQITLETLKTLDDLLATETANG